MTKKKYLIYSIEILFIVLIIIGGINELGKRKYLPIIDSDEVSWIFTSYYFNLYFLHHDFFSPDWKDYDAFDQPPLVKYIVGGALYSKGVTIDSLEPKRFLNSKIPMVNPQKYFDAVIPLFPNPKVVIPFTRSIMFMFALLALLMIYASIRALYGFFPALITTLLIISNSIFSTVSTQILGDPVLLFFFSLFLLLSAFYLKSKNRLYILPIFVVCGLAFLTKLNGILLFFMAITLILIRNRLSFSNRDTKWMISGIIAFIMMNIILNPVYINGGIKALWKMVEVRWSAFHLYQEAWKSLALLSVKERLVATVQMIFFQYSIAYRFIKVPLELILFLTGIYYLFTRKDILLITIFIFLVMIPICIIPFKLPRYFYCIFPFIYVTAGLSFCFFKEVANKGILMISGHKR